jgi:hypothetical protein
MSWSWSRLLDRRMEELREEFGLTAADLNPDLAPLGLPL